MAEYIEREDLIRRLELRIKSWSRDCNSNAPVMVRAYEDILHQVKNLPTADVVEVVRCKDCKHYEKWNDRTIICHKQVAFLSMKPNDFCSYGERSTDNAKGNDTH